MERCLASSKLQEARTAHLHVLKPCSRVLMLGEGPGRLLETLIQSMPHAQFVVVDQSRPMMEQATQVLIASGCDPGQFTWLHVDALHTDLGTETFDLVTTPFFLDCFTQPQLTSLIPRIANACKPDASWLLADFQVPAGKGWQKVRARWVHWVMYQFFRRVTSIAANHWTDPDCFLSAAGFHLLSRKESNYGLIRSDLWRRGDGSVPVRAGLRPDLRNVG
ncbi:class I SAM-dependent methyltransferase [Verrucomicrobia bacterium]|nr:class I SAM-dependent methyltransferase [Verrucomicrobiota bacterium]